MSKDDPQPELRFIVAWWPVRTATPIVRPKDQKTVAGHGRVVQESTMSLTEAAGYAELGFEVMADPFDMDAFDEWQKRNTPTKRWLKRTE